MHQRLQSFPQIRVKRQPKKWKTIFTNQVSDEDIQLKLYLKSNLQLSNEKTNNNLKMG